MSSVADGRFPTLHVVADSIPRGHFKAMKAVWEQGLEIRTEYDRRDADGNFIDPPSRDARVLIEVTNPFAQPRYPATSFCEIGTYIAEIMGAKDHMVVPMEVLIDSISSGSQLEATEWPYTYHQRLFDHPDSDGGSVDQIRLAVERVARTPYTRRAMATTSVPNVDSFLVEDVPCLREVQLRCPADASGNLVLNLNTTWRSRDLYKAWADNVVAITFLQQVMARQITEEMGGRLVLVGSYADYSTSLHIYGQDFSLVGGDAERGLRSFFDNFDEETYVARSFTSKDAAELLVIPQLRNLLTESQIEQWHFSGTSQALIIDLIRKIESGRLIA
jgi:hypothetical protein